MMLYYERKYREARRLNIVLMICYGFVLIALGIVLGIHLFVVGEINAIVSEIYPNKTWNVTINYDDLTPEETRIAENMISAIKPEYLAHQRSITFTHNLSKFSNDEDVETYAGYNYLGHNYILWSDWETSMKITVCHELLHTFMWRDELTHEVVYDLGEKLVCFKEIDKMKRGFFLS